MTIKAVLFDLDGTLLQMDQDHFIDTYLGAIAQHLAAYGYDPALFAKALWKGTGAMIKNDGTRKNEEVFWSVFKALFPERDIDADLPYFEEFYEKKFDSVAPLVATPDPRSKKTVELVRSKGLRIALATAPLFPSVATEKRIAWAGLSPDDFELFTTYENCYFAKPSLDYYRSVCDRMGILPEECLMVGNDVDDDMVARDLGMKVFLLTDHLVNRKDADISVYPNGSFDELWTYIDSLI